MLQASPKSFDKDIIRSPAFAIHRNQDIILKKNFHKLIAGKLTALI